MVVFKQQLVWPNKPTKNVFEKNETASQGHVLVKVTKNANFIPLHSAVFQVGIKSIHGCLSIATAQK